MTKELEAKFQVTSDAIFKILGMEPIEIDGCHAEAIDPEARHRKLVFQLADTWTTRPRIKTWAGRESFTWSPDRKPEAIASDFKARVMQHWIKYEDERFATAQRMNTDKTRIESATAELASLFQNVQYTIKNREYERDVLAEVKEHRVLCHVFRHYEHRNILCDIKIDSLTQEQAEKLIHFLQNGGI